MAAMARSKRSPCTARSVRPALCVGEGRFPARLQEAVDGVGRQGCGEVVALHEVAAEALEPAEDLSGVAKTVEAFFGVDGEVVELELWVGRRSGEGVLGDAMGGVPVVEALVVVVQLLQLARPVGPRWQCRDHGFDA